MVLNVDRTAPTFDFDPVAANQLHRNQRGRDQPASTKGVWKRPLALQKRIGAGS